MRRERKEHDTRILSLLKIERMWLNKAHEIEIVDKTVKKYLNNSKVTRKILRNVEFYVLSLQKVYSHILAVETSNHKDIWSI